MILNNLMFNWNNYYEFFMFVSMSTELKLSHGHVIGTYWLIHSLKLASNCLINIWQEQLLSSSQEGSSASFHFKLYSTSPVHSLILRPHTASTMCRCCISGVLGLMPTIRPSWLQDASASSTTFRSWLSIAYVSPSSSHFKKTVDITHSSEIKLSSWWSYLKTPLLEWL